MQKQDRVIYKESIIKPIESIIKPIISTIEKNEIKQFQEQMERNLPLINEKINQKLTKKIIGKNRLGADVHKDEVETVVTNLLGIAIAHNRFGMVVFLINHGAFYEETYSVVSGNEVHHLPLVCYAVHHKAYKIANYFIENKLCNFNNIVYSKIQKETYGRSSLAYCVDQYPQIPLTTIEKIISCPEFILDADLIYEKDAIKLSDLQQLNLTYLDEKVAKKKNALMQIIQLLLQKYPVDKISVQDFKQICLEGAISKDLRIISLFEEKGFDLSKDYPIEALPYTWTPLNIACLKNDKDLVSFILQRKNNASKVRSHVRLTINDDDYDTDIPAFVFACKYAMEDKQEKQFPEELNNDKLQSLAIVKMLVEQENADIFEEATLSRLKKTITKSILEFACESENEHKIDYILKKILASDRDEETKLRHITDAIRYCITANKIDLLVHHFSNYFNEQLPIKAVVKSSVKLRITAELSVPLKTSMLIMAITENKLSMVETLIAAGAQINPVRLPSESSVELTMYPLAYAMILKRMSIFKLLLGKNADPTIPIKMDAKLSEITLPELIIHICNQELIMKDFFALLLTHWLNNYRDNEIYNKAIMDVILYKKSVYLEVLLEYKNTLLEKQLSNLDKEHVLNYVITWSTKGDCRILELLLDNGFLANLQIETIEKFLINVLLSRQPQTFKLLLRSIQKEGLSLVDYDKSNQATHIFKKCCEVYHLGDGFYLKQLLNIRKDPIAYALREKNITLFRQLLSNGFETTANHSALLNQLEYIDFSTVVLQKKGLEKSSEFNLLFNRLNNEEKKMEIKEQISSPQEYFNLLQNKLLVIIDDVESFDKKIDKTGLCFSLFQFYAVFNKLFLVYEENINVFDEANDPNNIFSEKAIIGLRNKLAHYYDVFTDMHFSFLVGLTKAFKNRIQLWLKGGAASPEWQPVNDFSKEYIVEMMNFLRVNPQEISNIERIQNNLGSIETKIEKLLAELNQEDELYLRDLRLIALTECLWKLGESLQQLQNQERLPDVFNKEDMISLIKCRNLLSHEVNEPLVNNTVAPNFIFWLMTNFYNNLNAIKCDLNLSPQFK